MTRVLLTAFEPYDEWKSNASWLALVDLTRQLPADPVVTTRLYPVDFEDLQRRLAEDLTRGFDYVILTGQAPGRPRIELETIALNIGTHSADSPPFQLVKEGPLAYSSTLPASHLCERIRQAGIPAGISYHAGTYLCNAALYIALHTIAVQNMESQAIFIHLPLDTSQTAAKTDAVASLPSSVGAEALSVILGCLGRQAD